MSAPNFALCYKFALIGNSERGWIVFSGNCRYLYFSVTPCPVDYRTV